MSNKNPTESIAAAQAQSVEQALAYSRAAAASFERLTRQHYAMVGDLVDYTLAQLHLPSDTKDPRAALEAQAVNARELAEKTRSRMEEYAEIATTMRDLAGSTVSAATSAGPAAASRQDTAESKASAGGTPAAKAAPAAAKAQNDEKNAAPSKPAAKQSASKPVAKRVAKAAAKPATKTVTKTATKPVTGTRAKKKAASRKG